MSCPSHEHEPAKGAPDSPLTPAALDAIVAHRPKYVGFLKKRLGASELAEDLFQQAFARAITRGGQLRDETRAVAWFYRLLRNEVIDHRRRLGAASRALEQLEAELATLGGADESEAARPCACVGTALEALNPAYRDALRRIEVEGTKVRDYAEASGITPNTAAVRAFRAREALGREVRRTCGTCAALGCVDCTCEPVRPDR